MKTISLNLTVREALMDAGLSLHYYFDFLHYAIRALEEFNYDAPIDVKAVNLSVTDYQRAILPSDCVSIVDVSGRYGEHLLPFSMDKALNKLYKYDSSGNKIAHPNATDTSFVDEILYNSFNYRTHTTEAGEHMGRFFGASTTQKQTFGIDEVNSEIVFSNDVTVTECVLTYISDGISTSEANLITPIIKDYIQKACHYKRVQFNGAVPMNQKMLAREEVKLAEKRARARVHSMSYADIIRSMRRGLHASIKN